MKTMNLPEGNACGADDDSGTPIVDYAEHWAKTLFFMWVTLTEHKWVILAERRGHLILKVTTDSLDAGSHYCMIKDVIIHYYGTGDRSVPGREPRRR